MSTVKDSDWFNEHVQLKQRYSVWFAFIKFNGEDIRASGKTAFEASKNLKNFMKENGYIE